MKTGKKTLKGLDRPPEVGIVMGSDSDMPIMENTLTKLEDFGIEYEVRILSAHRTPDMAAEYAKNNPAKLGGLIMFASYPANNLDFVDFPIPILTIIGSKDPGSPEQEAFYQDISPSARLFMIEGGNHRQYADYSFQKDDGIATISALEQQQQIIFATTEFLGSLK